VGKRVLKVVRESWWAAGIEGRDFFSLGFGYTEWLEKNGKREKWGKDGEFEESEVLSIIKKSLVVQARVDKVNSPGGFSWQAFL